MLNYAFLIDNRRCIGCHACSVACKTEHEVPLGVARTWVKYVEKGDFPETRRTFQVTRCNHCDDAPCVEICPTTALFRRQDGIVDFDGGRCIGCKACMQGCPYDALYIDPATETAAKCNFCAHRVEVGLEPPCVTVCPTQAIVAGDLDDPSSRIAQMTGRIPLQVRKPEKGTRPKVFYVEADAAALVPAAAPPVVRLHVGAGAAAARPAPGCRAARRRGRAAPHLRRARAAPQLVGLEGVGLSLDEVAGRGRVPRPGRARRRPFPWREPVPTGALLIALARPRPRPARCSWRTCGSPSRFLWTLTRPQWRSWLTRGSYVIAAYGLALAALLALGLAAAARCRPSLTGLTALLAAGTATYTAFLFAQAKGRDLWQTALLGPHMLVQALTAGRGPVRAVVAARPPAPERPARGGRGLRPPRHRGRAAGRAAHPGRAASRRACSSWATCCRCRSSGTPSGLRPAGLAPWPSSASSSGSTSTCRRPSGSRSHDDRAARCRDPRSSRTRPPIAGTTGPSTTCTAWPRRVERHYMLVPTTCFNCEAACGLLAYVDSDTLRVRKFEGNPLHPASRGRNCAKGPATINQIHDPERILYPLKRAGARGAGKWERVSWDQVLDEIAARIRKALHEGRRNEVMYHVGRPGHERLHGPRAARPGASTATTRTPTSARRRRASATRSGPDTTGPRPTTPTRGSSC